MTHSPRLLSQILNKIGQNKSENKSSLVVFDLDSTLFDVSPRLKQIMIDFAEDSINKKKFPESCALLKTVETFRSDWGIKNALIRAGLDGHHPDFHHALRDYWMQSFFSNEYLEYDQPYEGAQDYVQKIYAAGADIVYLTGRDIARMGKSTGSVLKKWSFPLDVPRTELILKPEKGMDDAKFKSDYFAQLPEGKYTTIWFFENEPQNTNLVQACHDHVEIVFFQSTHAGVQEPHPDLPKIMHYLLDSTTSELRSELELKLRKE